jgi:hypothetical protein
MLPFLSRDQSSRELLHKAKLFRLLFDNDVIDRPYWTQVREKNPDARARFDRGPYRSAKLIIDEPGPDRSNRSGFALSVRMTSVPAGW